MSTVLSVRERLRARRIEERASEPLRPIQRVGEPDKTWGRYTSREKCLQCGREFTKGSRVRRLYCGAMCRHQAKNGRRRESRGGDRWAEPKPRRKVSRMRTKRKPSMGVNCDRCGGATAVIDSRQIIGAVKRRRQCVECDERFTTYERMTRG